MHAWYGRANDGLSTLALSGALTKYHGWNYEFTMTQTVPRLMSFPAERTEAAPVRDRPRRSARRSLAGTGLGVGSSCSPSAASRAASRRPSASPPNLQVFTWAHAVGYPLEDPKAGGQRPRLKFEKLFHKDTYGQRRTRRTPRSPTR